eukprot:TRINITY_DN8138_c0_g1_i1.p1 TRINITY_DN8138_c0_g1~~TRINITY_DN8138_c0_g1_i1.p1  ORF type:complete len:94 (+),score=1.46 TRINITY_DN8138_c0_g1_i1:424-705(+)
MRNKLTSLRIKLCLLSRPWKRIRQAGKIKIHLKNSTRETKTTLLRILRRYCNQKWRKSVEEIDVSGAAIDDYRHKHVHHHNNQFTLRRKRKLT